MEKLKHLTGPGGGGYYRFQTSMDAEVAQDVSAALMQIKARFPGKTMSAAWVLSLLEIENGVKAQARIEHALEILKSRHFADENHTAAPFVVDVLKALTGCPTNTTVEFIGESDEYREFWGRDDNAE